MFSIVISRQSDEKWQSKTLFLTIFDLLSSIVLNFSGYMVKWELIKQASHRQYTCVYVPFSYCWWLQTTCTQMRTDQKSVLTWNQIVSLRWYSWKIHCCCCLFVLAPINILGPRFVLFVFVVVVFCCLFFCFCIFAAVVFLFYFYWGFLTKVAGFCFFVFI